MEKINTFVIPHLNYKGIDKCLSSLRKYTPPNYYVILVDQSEEGRPDLEPLVDLRVRVKHLGFAKAMNTGIRLADTEYVSCFNDDVEFIDSRWWDGIIETFSKYGEQALGVNPASIRNPDGAGGHNVMPGFSYQENWTPVYYDKVLQDGKGYIIDGICIWGTVFKRDRLDRLPGTIPGKVWFDELFWPGGGEDYDMNRRAYMTCSHCYRHKQEHPFSDHEFRSLRMLGTNLSYCWHWWYSTRSPITGVASVKFDGKTFSKKWNFENPDIYGKTGPQDIPLNTLKNY